MNTPDQDKLKWLQLYRTYGIGPVNFWRLLEKYGTAADAIKDIGKKFTVYSEKQAQAEIIAHKKQGLSLLAAFEPDFPELLKNIGDCPPIISVYGNQSVLNELMIGLVGARNASIAGKSLSFNIAKDLSLFGLCIVSGMARGIDAAAHQGALAYGAPTVAVLAGGVDYVYPSEHEKLYHEIAKTGGAVISESPLGTRPMANLFARRNRLISGLGCGVIVIEAAKQSGSLITAEYAASQGREVFVVPGSPLDPRCQGSNNLIKQGATLIESARDVREVLDGLSFFKNPIRPTSKASPPPGCQLGYQLGHQDHSKEPEQELGQELGDNLYNDATNSYDMTLGKELNKGLKEKIMGDLSHVPVDFEYLVGLYNLPAATVMAVLVEMEIEGKVLSHSNGSFSLA